MVLLIWCRDPKNTWQSELAEGRPPKRITGGVLVADLAPEWRKAAARVYDPWTGRWSDARLEEGRLALPAFSRSVVVRIVR